LVSHQAGVFRFDIHDHFLIIVLSRQPVVVTLYLNFRLTQFLDIMNYQIDKETFEVLAHIVSLSDDAVITVSSEGKISGWNNGAEKILGYTSVEIIGKPAAVLNARQNSFVDAINGTDLTDVTQKAIVWKKKDGSPVTVSVTVYPVRNSGMERHGFIAVGKPIDAKTKEEKIFQLTKQLEALSYAVSHDLRAPVRSLLNYAEILEEDFGNDLDDKGKKVLSIITRNSEKLMHLIEDLLGLARVWKHEVLKTRIDMNSLVRPIVEEQTAAQGNIEIRLNDLHHTDGDKNLLKQVWQNLLSNAVKYSEKKERPVIEIGSLTSNESVTYFVKDNGVGFDMQYANKLFTPFQRLHTQSEFDGNGIGLAIVHQIISRHAGHVWTEARVNEGATFYFSLPQ
jgi:PAS domain S-box-containing protein